MKDWEIYQQLAAQIYAELDPAAVVKHDDRIIGASTGIPRQIDVSIRSKIATHDILIIVQVKDLQTPADVNVVGEFCAVIQDVRAHKGILICSSGFTAAAQTYAESLSIDLCRLVDAKHRRWGIDLRIPLVWVENPVNVHANIVVRPLRTNKEALKLDGNVARWKVSPDQGLTTKTLGQLFSDAWNTGQIPRTPHTWHLFQVDTNRLRVLLGEKDFWCDFDIEFRYFCDRTGWLGSFPIKTLTGILNFSQSTLRAKVSISPTDVPNVRNDSWARLEDPERFFQSQPNAIHIELTELDPASMTMSSPNLKYSIDHE